MSTPQIGSIGWVDLTVPDGGAIRDFYERVTGWTSQPVDMDGYADYCMVPPGSQQPAAGICHARGPNIDLPPQWLVYITVADIEASVAACTSLGGTVIRAPRDTCGAMIAVIKDPAGAVCALYQPPKG